MLRNASWSTERRPYEREDFVKRVEDEPISPRRNEGSRRCEEV